MKLILPLLLYSTFANAEPKVTKALKWSWAALVAGNAMDAASSWGRPELNPILGPTFGPRAAVIKFGIAGAVIGVEYLFVRRHPQIRKPLVIGNFIAGGLLCGVAVRNHYFHTGM